MAQEPNPNINNGTNNGTEPVVNTANGSGEPQQNASQQDVEALVKARMAEKEEELRKQILEEIENEKNLTDAQKLEVERQKLAKEKEEWQKKLETETIALNVQKVKSIYTKAGFSEEMIELLVDGVKLDYSVEETRANNIVKSINAYIEAKTKDLTNQIQSNQPSPTMKGGNNGQVKQSFFEQFNEPSPQSNESFFK